ncbi:RNA polymerase sigma factor [candidate division KSB1 bacterium]|nr:RNA polymerase sigma factor [candidate division KSB1 bacterium]
MPLDLSALFESLREKLVTAADRIVNDRDDAEDVVQEVFVRLYHKLERFQGEARLSTWLYRVTVNASLDALRRFKRRQKRETSLALIINEETLAQENPNHHAQIELSEKLQSALARLRKPYRAAIVLRDFEGLAYDEIAEVLQIDKGTVASRLHRAYAKLKKELEALGIDQNYLKS